MRSTAVLIGLAACGGTPGPDPTPADVFAAIGARDCQRLEAILDAKPELAGAANDDHASAVMVALFTIDSDKETFVRRQDNACLRVLLAHHPTLDVFDAAAAGDTARLAKLIAESPARAHEMHPWGLTPLHVAAFAGQVAAVDQLAAAGAPIDEASRNKFKNTPLILAVLGRQVDAARALLAKSANVEASEEGGFRALHLAAEGNDTAMIELLLEHHAAIDAPADDGSTPLAVARKKNRADAVRVHTARGAK